MAPKAGWLTRGKALDNVEPMKGCSPAAPNRRPGNSHIVQNLFDVKSLIFDQCVLTLVFSRNLSFPYYNMVTKWSHITGFYQICSRQVITFLLTTVRKCAFKMFIILQ